MVLLLNFWAAVLVTLALITMVLQLFGTMAILDVKLSAVPAVLLVMAIGRGVNFTVHLSLVSVFFFKYQFRYTNEKYKKDLPRLQCKSLLTHRAFIIYSFCIIF